VCGASPRLAVVDFSIWKKSRKFAAPPIATSYMSKYRFSHIVLAMLLLSSCSVDEDEPSEPTYSSDLRLKVGMEQLRRSRVDVTSDEIFSWSTSDGDEIMVQADNGNFYTWTQKGVNNDGTANFMPSSEHDWSGYVVFPGNVKPCISSSGELCVKLPSEYAENRTAPLMIGEYAADVNLEYACGLFRVAISNVPSSATKFEFSTSNRQICGDFTVTENTDGKRIISGAESSENNKVSIHLTAGDIADGTVTFNLPLPIGEYDGFELGLYADSDKIFSKSSTGSFSVERGTLLQMSSTALIGDCAMSVENADLITVNDSSISIRMPYDTDLQQIKAAFSGDASIAIDGSTIENGDVTLNLSDPISLRVNDKSYVLTVAFSELPVVYVSTPDHVEIANREDWIDGGNITIGNTAGGKFDVSTTSSFRGRGNSTWGLAPKKGYAIKLEQKTSILGMPSHKRWVLLANWNDCSFSRTTLAFHMGDKSLLAYTPRIHDVELVLNGSYWGLYQLTEQIKINKNRVNVGDDGFLIEADYRASIKDGDVVFYVTNESAPFVIKDPDVVFYDDNYSYVKNFFIEFDKVLFSDDWLDDEKGYKTFIDINSFVDWYIINEFSKNNDSIFYSSCYMNLNRSTGKLAMGPIWDFDLSWGNYIFSSSTYPCNISTGWWVRERTTWYQRMFTDPEFVSLLQDRFDYFYSLQSEFSSLLEQQYSKLKYAAYGDNLRWGKLSTSSDYESVSESFLNSCIALNNFMSERWQWMHSELHSNSGIHQVTVD
jgi:hypothetical protein